jgi:DNA-binding transcriptional MerR regulator
MLIGELASRTNVPTRLLRYYEEQGLLQPERASNGYRHYPETLIERVTQIRGLLDAGVPTKIIREILPYLDDPGTFHVFDASPELIASLRGYHDQLDARVRCLARNRDALASYLAAVHSRSHSTGSG